MDEISVFWILKKNSEKSNNKIKKNYSRVRVMVFSATFNTISVISCRS